MNKEEIAKLFVSIYRSEKPFEKYDLYDDECISIENPINEETFQVQGLEKIKEKGQNFYKQFKEVIKTEVSNPEITENGFIVYFNIEGLDKTGGEKNVKEKAIYTVKDGKIVREEFIY